MIARAFNVVLQNFCQSSGALINKSKSVFYKWNVEQCALLRISYFFGFSGFDKWDKITYLGLPLTLGKTTPSLWLEVLAKLKKKISSWGGQWLSKSWKLNLIKSVLSAFPVFQSICFWLLSRYQPKLQRFCETFSRMAGSMGKIRFIW